MSIILGVSYTSHDTAIALLKDGKILGIYEEEKLTGVKACFNVWAPPTGALQIIKDEFGIEFSDIDKFALASFYKKDFVRENSHVMSGKTIEVSHHTSHTLGSYLTSGMSGKVLSISHDGKGNRSRGKILLCENGSYEEIHSQHIPTTASLAGLWAATTFFLGWKMLKDEGKVVGLAAHGKYSERFYSFIKSCIHYDGNFNFRPANFESLFHYVCTHVYRPEGVFEDKQKRADFAYCLQLVTEECMRDLLADVKNKYPEYTKVCFSGGLFANVKLNMFINDLGLFEEIYIHPAMSDSGLALGAALKVALDLEEINGPFKLENAFLGQQHSKNAWDRIIDEHSSRVSVEEMTYEKVGGLVNDGYVVGVFVGRTEYGPRALGNRSIVVKPTDKDTHKRLNEKLRRTEIMPFAPSVLEEHADEIFDIKQSRYTAEFMTLCYDTRKEWLQKIPAVVHDVDGTARPQIVIKDKNPSFHKIISAYKEISGIPVVLNTSLNAHGEPINNYPSQVIKHLLDDSIDFIVTEDYIIRKSTT
jgi:carbamoyltransferase